MNSSPIGIFDSGVGGLSVLNAIHKILPNENLIYLADQKHVPYGSRPIDQIREFSGAITQYLLARNAKIIVVACNTASAAALYHLRAVYQDTSFVGMEPAVKPAAESTHSGVVGVLATPATFQGALYASVVERFANGVEIIQDTCPGLVTQIEKGVLDSPEIRSILERALNPMLSQDIDRVVMGCTHYPFVIPLIREIVGPQVDVIDPAPAVARQTRHLLDKYKLVNTSDSPGTVQAYTTGDRVHMEDLIMTLVGWHIPVETLTWEEGSLIDSNL